MSVGPISRFRPSLTPGDFWAALCTPAAGRDLVAEFERRFARMLGVPEAVAVPSARAALGLVLRHATLPPTAVGGLSGGEVILPAFTYWSMPAAVIRAGMRPVFVDVGPRTYLIDPEKVESAITPRTRAIVPTHLYGCPCELDRILEMARRHGLLVIEDCAQSCGARYGGRRTGSLGDAAVFTFGTTKNFTTLFGGLVATDRPGLAQSIRAEVRTYAPAPRGAIAKALVEALAMSAVTEPHVFAALLYPTMRLAARRGRDFVHDLGDEKPEASGQRPDAKSQSQESATEPLVSGLWPLAAGRWRAAQAAVGLEQLKRLDRNNTRRARAGRFLAQDLDGAPGILLPVIPDPAEREHIFMSFMVRARDRDGLRRTLLERGVDTAAGYMHNCAATDLFREYAADCPVAAAIDREQVHLPVYPTLSEAELAFVAREVRRAARGRA